MNVANHGELSKDFTQFNKPLVPVVFCHGLTSNRTMHSGTCRDLASHGYLVFILDFSDGSPYYCEDAAGNGTVFDTLP